MKLDIREEEKDDEDQEDRRGDEKLDPHVLPPQPLPDLDALLLEDVRRVHHPVGLLHDRVEVLPALQHLVDVVRHDHLGLGHSHASVSLFLLLAHSQMKLRCLERVRVLKLCIVSFTKLVQQIRCGARLP